MRWAEKIEDERFNLLMILMINDDESATNGGQRWQSMKIFNFVIFFQKILLIFSVFYVLIQIFSNFFFFTFVLKLK